MRVFHEGDTVGVESLGEVLCSIRLEDREGCTFGHSLEGSGDPAALLKLYRHLRTLPFGGPLYVSIEAANPRFERLLRVYRRLGMSVSAVVLEFRRND